MNAALLAKDLIADILPPPLNLVELRLFLSMINEGTLTSDQGQVERNRLVKDYQGRGFAAVAGEVRSLAQRSAAAAREINQLIAGSVQRVQAGSRLVHDAGQTMQEIVALVQRVSTLIGGISTATREQTTGIGVVSGAVSQLDSSTQQNAAMVEQAAAAANGLNRQADDLVRLVATLRTAAA